jgi:KUP system potassium uptake protein
MSPLLFVDLVFLSSNALKIPTGGWLPLTIAGVLMLVMVTWVRGTRVIFRKGHDQSVPMKDLRRMLKLRPPFRIPGTAVFLTSDPQTAPPALMHNMKHNKVFHRHNILLTVKTARTPRAPEAERVSVERLDENFTSVTVTCGFMEQPRVTEALAAARDKGLDYDPMATSYFLGRRSIAASPSSKVPGWQRKLYAFLHRNASDPTAYFNIPAGRVVEMGAQISL